jgi:hypothetical protein
LYNIAVPHKEEQRIAEGMAVPYFDADLLLWCLLWMD